MLYQIGDAVQVKNILLLKTYPGIVASYECKEIQDSFGIDRDQEAYTVILETWKTIKIKILDFGLYYFVKNSKIILK